MTNRYRTRGIDGGTIQSVQDGSKPASESLRTSIRGRSCSASSRVRRCTPSDPKAITAINDEIKQVSLAGRALPFFLACISVSVACTSVSVRRIPPGIAPHPPKDKSHTRPMTAHGRKITSHPRIPLILFSSALVSTPSPASCPPASCSRWPTELEADSLSMPTTKPTSPVTVPPSSPRPSPRPPPSAPGLPGLPRLPPRLLVVIQSIPSTAVGRPECGAFIIPKPVPPPCTQSSSLLARLPYLPYLSPSGNTPHLVGCAISKRVRRVGVSPGRGTSPPSALFLPAAHITNRIAYESPQTLPYLCQAFARRWMCPGAKISFKTIIKNLGPQSRSAVRFLVSNPPVCGVLSCAFFPFPSTRTCFPRPSSSFPSEAPPAP